MPEQQYDATALVALPKIMNGSTPEKGLLSWSRPYLFQQVRNRGVDVVVTRGADSLNAETEHALNVIRPEYSQSHEEVSIRQMGDIAMDQFGMMRNIVRPVELDHIFPVLNPTTLRVLAKDKYDASRLLIAPAGMYGRESGYLETIANLEEVLDSIRGAQVVAKPNNGLRSRGVIVGSKREIYDQLFALNATNYLIEQRMDFSSALPGIKAESADEQARLDEANRTGVIKEVRLFAFGEGQWDVVGRIARPGETDFRDDKWLYLDQDTIPTELYVAGAVIMDNIEKQVGTQDVNVAIDYVYTTTDTDTDPKWRVMEVNAAEPQLVQLDQHETIGKAQHDMLATQIARLARREVK